MLTALEAILASEHPAIDAITAIVVETGPLTASARFTQATPRTFASRQFSFPHLIAMRLLGVPPGPAWCDPRWDDDPAVAVLRAKVRFEAHPRGEDFVHSLTRNQMRTLPGGIRLHLVDGRSCGPRATPHAVTLGIPRPSCRTRRSPRSSAGSRAVRSSR